MKALHLSTQALQGLLLGQLGLKAPDDDLRPVAPNHSTTKLGGSNSEDANQG
jgi:hypothetical protein